MAEAFVAGSLGRPSKADVGLHRENASSATESKIILQVSLAVTFLRRRVVMAALALVAPT
jgi:hypothetical protein